MMHPTQVCPRCDAEFEATVDTCSDCGVRLVAPDTLARPLRAEEELVAVRVDTRAWVMGLATVLADRGVPSDVRPVEAKSACGAPAFKWVLLVRPGDAKRAVAIDREYWMRHAPQERDMDARPPDPARAGACPACGETLTEESDECPSCGLWLGE